MAERSPRLSNGARTGAWLGGLTIALMLVLAGLQLASFSYNRQLRAEVEQSYQRQFLLQRLLSLHQDVETGLRGFALTGQEEFLQPFNRALSQIEPALKQLRAQAKDANRMKHVAAIERLSAQKIRNSQEVIAMRRGGDSDGARARVAGGFGRRVMDSLRSEVSVLQGYEVANLNQLLRSSSEANARELAYTVAVELMLLALLGTAFIAYLASYRRLLQVSAEARDSSQRQSAIFDAANDAMIVIDHRRCIESLNPAARRLFALGDDDLSGTPVDRLFDLPEGAELRAGEGATDGTINYPHLNAKRGEEQFDAEVAASEVKLADGVRTLLLVRDSTERNRVERMKNEFVSTVSHELRTPLTSIRGALSLLDHSIGAKLEDRPRQLLKIAKSNSERLSLLVNDILDIEKIGSGRFELELDHIDLRDVAAAAEEQTRTYASDRNVRLTLSSPEQPLMIMGDSNRLLQAIVNLISNAAKFSPEDGEVELSAERSGKFARITVSDLGPGIPVEFRSQIFDRFSQASGHSSTRAGTGLGLAITKAIVESHGGTIDYETRLGKGTRFWIDLPLDERPAE